MGRVVLSKKQSDEFGCVLERVGHEAVKVREWMGGWAVQWNTWLVGNSCQGVRACSSSRLVEFISGR